MPEIRGFLSREGLSQGDCLWCGGPSTSRMVAPGLEGSPEVPLHALCAASIILAYRKWERLGIVSGRLRVYAERVQQVGAGPRRIEAGHAQGEDD